MMGKVSKKRQIMKGWNSRKLRLNEESKVQVRIWIATIDTRKEEKEIGVQRALTKRRARERALAKGEKKNDGHGERKKESFNRRERERE
jgi:hypothetical protein